MSSYIAIASQTLSSSQNSVTFNSIPTTLNGKTLRDLVVVVSIIGENGDSPDMRFNSDTGSNYSSVVIRGSSAAASSTVRTSFTALSLSGNGSIGVSTTDPVSIHISVLDFAQTNKHKTVLARTGRSDGWSVGTAGRWASTSAITSLTIRMTSGNNFLSGSTFSLFGIEG